MNFKAILSSFIGAALAVLAVGMLQKLLSKDEDEFDNTEE